ncbi:glycerophosphodiester phosphodiesterase [Shewanella sp. WXL01]|uniref:glycerophosphodiester phosphodiesterase n=1 Tax=Shewanella sp. WXL01 TaxID=2709721 RepID=UPI0014384404|nr:glycerophosphodiester phosphodiesterase [Shewanella sp. WXL01]NKF49492.1 glycerophosphodiester phosphodiesterase [Shewanella sp. WXL01]
MLVFAHRGASGYQAENTLAAMQMALDLSVTAIEIDVHNVEGELYVFHDRRLENKSDGFGPIHLATKAELAQLHILGEPIPTLWQVLELINGRCMVNIELKGCFSIAPFMDLYPRIFDELNFTHRQVLVSSFNHHYLATLKSEYGQAYVAPLVDGVPLNLAQAASDLNAYSINLSINFVNQAMIEDAHQRGVKVFVYTVDEADDIRALHHFGVDGIFSNYPDKAQAVVDSLVMQTDDGQASHFHHHEDQLPHWFE